MEGPRIREKERKKKAKEESEEEGTRESLLSGWKGRAARREREGKRAIWRLFLWRLCHGPFRMGFCLRL